MNSLTDPEVADVLARLHREADAQRPELRQRVATMADDESSSEAWPHHLREFYLPVSREQGLFLYQTVRAVRARRVVEFGSSFGVSTIYLAAGLRDSGAGLVIGSELIDEKAATARSNLGAAGLDDHAEIRSGDARQTLADPGGTIDLVLLDGGPARYTEILQLLVPHLRLGAVVIADNIEDDPDDPHPYARWVRDPANGFVSSSITLKGGTEYSVLVDDPPPGSAPSSDSGRPS